MIVALMIAFVIFDFILTKKKGAEMKIQKFGDEVTKEEGKKISVNKGQVMEILKIVNRKTNGALYREIRKLPDTK